MRTDGTSMDCVFHEDRYVFDALVRDLRTAHRLLPRRQHSKVMAMAVCTCRKKASYRQPISEARAHAAADYLLLTPPSLFRHLSHSACCLVTSSARDVTDRHDVNGASSQARLAVLLHEILLGKFTLLEEEEAANVARSKAGADAPKSKEKSSHLRTSRRTCRRDIARKIVAKKKRKYPVRMASVLPMFGGSTRQLFQDDQVGEAFSALRSKYACVLELDHAATGVKMAANEQGTVVNAWCSTREVGEEALGLLTRVAVKIQKANCQRWQQMVDLRVAKTKERRLCRLLYDSSISNDFNQLDYKSFLARDFETKVLKKQRNRGRPTSPTSSTLSQKRPVQREDGSSVADGHCLHCLLTFQHFRTAVVRGDVKQECRHHPGYVTGGKWTCCDEQTHSQHPTHGDHAQNGCAVGRHSFRPHRKAARGVGAKAYRYERSYRQRRLSLAPDIVTPLIY